MFFDQAGQRKYWENFLQVNMALNILIAGLSCMQNSLRSLAIEALWKNQSLNKMKNMPPIYNRCIALD